MKRIVKVTNMERRRNSVNGNPKWRVLTDDGHCWDTKKDTGDAYKITGNETGREVEVTLDNHGEIVGWDPL